jgi:hypothetical protein
MTGVKSRFDYQRSRPERKYRSLPALVMTNPLGMTGVKSRCDYQRSRPERKYRSLAALVMTNQNQPAVYFLLARGVRLQDVAQQIGLGVALEMRIAISAVIIDANRLEVVRILDNQLE